MAELTPRLTSVDSFSVSMVLKAFLGSLGKRPFCVDDLGDCLVSGLDLGLFSTFCSVLAVSSVLPVSTDFRGSSFES